MSIEITTWLRAYFALQASAMESRGFVEQSSGSDEVVRWPRTTGADIVAIAAVLDPYVRAQPLRFGGHGIARRWRAVVDAVEQYALGDLRGEYVENRSFWNTLPAICVYLHSEGAALPPPEVLDGLLAVLRDPIELRNIGPKGDGPFKHFDNVKTFDDLYIAQWRYLRDLRGADERDREAGAPYGNRYTKFPIPRTTNADVIALADYWNRQLADVKTVMGRAGIEATWKPAYAEANAIARTGDPNAVYPKNNLFWREMREVAMHVAVADEAPTKWDLAKEAIKDSITHLPENIATGAKKVAGALGEAAGDVAHGVGKIANEAGKGLFSGFGTPMLVGAGLLGLYLISRSRSKED